MWHSMLRTVLTFSRAIPRLLGAYERGIRIGVHCDLKPLSLTAQRDISLSMRQLVNLDRYVPAAAAHQYAAC